jgi:uncharacterized protein YfcZ (UPF0381/DUF406 family)
MKTIRGSLGGVPKSNFFSFQDIIMSVTGILIVIALMLALQIDRVGESSDPNRISSDSDPGEPSDADLESLEMTLMNLKERLEVLHSAARKTESEAELRMEIARIEERILGQTPHPAPENKFQHEPHEIEAIKTKANEIIRLRDEIKQCEEAIAQSSASAGQASQMMLELEQKVKDMEAMVASVRIKSKKLRLIRELSDTTKEPVIVDVRKKVLMIMRFDQPQAVAISSLNEFYAQIRKFRKQDQYVVLYFRPSGASRFEELRQAVKNSGFEVGYDAIEEDAELALGKAGDQ